MNDVERVDTETRPWSIDAQRLDRLNRRLWPSDDDLPVPEAARHRDGLMEHAGRFVARAKDRDPGDRERARRRKDPP